METAASRQLNLPKSSAYIELPRDFLGKNKSGVVNVFDGLTDYAVFMLAVIHTMNKAIKDYCKITYEDFIERLGGSKETVSRCKKDLVERGIIEDSGKSRYKIKINYNKKWFIKVKDYLHKTIFEVMLEVKTESGKEQMLVQKRLKRSAIINLAYLEQQTTNPKTNGEYISSQGRIGTALNKARTTIGDAQRELVGAGLITAEGGYGTGNKSLTKYTVVPEVLAVKDKEFKPKVQEQAAPPSEEEKKRTAAIMARVELEYTSLRQAALDRAEQALSNAKSDVIYGKIRRELDELNFKVAFAEINNPALAAELNARKAELEAAGDRRLDELHILKEDFEPHYKCRICNDTGYTATGQACGCMPKLIKELSL